MHYKLLPISKQPFWNILKKFHFINLPTNSGISLKILNLLFLTLSAHNLYLKLIFSIQMGLNSKASFCSLKEYKIFYTKFHSAQQNELDALIQVIHLHFYPINIASDSLYSVFVLRNRETSTINSNQSIIQQLFLELVIVKNHTSPIYIQFSSVAQSCLTLCNPMNCSTPGLCPSPFPGVHSNSCPSSW